MGYYRRRSATVEARQVDTMDYDGMCEIVRWCGGDAIGEHGYVIAVSNPQGRQRAGHGDKGNYYRLAPDRFDAAYEPYEVEDKASPL
jgi:hypothetical protein